MRYSLTIFLTAFPVRRWQRLRVRLRAQCRACHDDQRSCQHCDPAKWYVTRLVRRIAATVLEAAIAIRPDRIWNWIEWLDRHRAHGDDANKRLVAVFRENGNLRAALLEHVLLTPCAKNTWMAGHRLFDTGLELHPTPEDVAGVLRTLGARTRDGSIDRETWRDLLRHGRTADGLSAPVQEAAIEIANGDPELLSILDEISESPAAEWKASRAEREAKKKAQREAVCRVHRQRLAERAEDVPAGGVHLLELPACIYLDRNVALDALFHFDAEATPKERLSAFLGEELADRVMSGFVAVLARDDLPSASRIVEVHCENEYCVAEAPMICGVMEMFRRGLALDGIERDTLAAAYMAWQRGPESESSKPSAIASAMENALFRSDSDWEDLFRMSIEPQLDRNRKYPNDLTRLAYEACFSGLAGRLSVEWLRRYPALNLHVQTELLACALRNAPRDQVRELVLDLRDRAHPDDATRAAMAVRGLHGRPGQPQDRAGSRGCRTSGVHLDPSRPHRVGKRPTLRPVFARPSRIHRGVLRRPLVERPEAHRLYDGRLQPVGCKRFHPGYRLCNCKPPGIRGDRRAAGPESPVTPPPTLT